MVNESQFNGGDIIKNRRLFKFCQHSQGPLILVVLGIGDIICILSKHMSRTIGSFATSKNSRFVHTLVCI